MLTASASDGITPDLDAVVRRLTAANRAVGRDVAKASRKALLANVRGRRPGGLSFSGMGTKLGASTRTLPGAAAATVFVDAVPAGAWKIAEHGRSVSVPKRAAALHIGDGFAMSASATHGRPGLWWGASDAVDAAVLEVVERAYDAAMGV